MQLGRHMAELHVGHRAILGCRDVVSAWTRSTMMKCHGLAAKSHVDHRVLVGVATTTTTEMVHLLTLRLVLNLFPVWGVPNERENRVNALNEQSALRRPCVIQSSLYNYQHQ
jgi:hypothetical protein